MEEKKILNIVEFSVTDTIGEKRPDKKDTTWTQAAVFYEDGSVEIIPIDDAIELSKKNNRKIRKTTPEELEKNFQKYRTKKIRPKRAAQKEKKEKNTTLFQKIKNKLNTVKEFIMRTPIVKPFIFLYSLLEKVCYFATLHILQRKKLKAIKEAKKAVEGQQSNENKEKKRKKEKEEKKGLFQRFKKEKDQTGTKNGFFNRIKKARDKNKSKKKKKRFFTRVKAAIFAVILMVAGAVGVSSCQKGNSSTDANNKTRVESTTDALDNLDKAEIIRLIQEYKLTADQVAQLIRDGKITNDDFKHLSFEQLLNITSSSIQQQEMAKISDFLNSYNITFADKCIDTDAQEIRTSLTWTEANALNLAYNNYSQEDMQAIFNGSKSIDFTKAYKEGYLQLLGAFVLATENNPVQLDKLINDENGKTFVKNYETAFYECKKLTGEEQKQAVTELYKKAVNDFAITSTNQSTIDSYKSAVAPIVVAATSLFENLEIDQTLVDQVSTYFNEVGYKAVENFNIAKTLNGNEDQENPTYEQYKDAKVNSLENENAYYQNDKKRDLSRLENFQSLVNWHFNLDANGDLVVGNTLEESIVLPPVEPAPEEPKEQESEVALTEATVTEAAKPAVANTSVPSSMSASTTYTTQHNYDYSYDNNSSLEVSAIPEVPETTYAPVESNEVANTEGTEVTYNPEDELENFQVGETNGQTFFEYDEPSQETEFEESNEPQTSDDTGATEVAEENQDSIDSSVSEETNTENNDNANGNTANEEEYIVTQMPDSNHVIIEYEEVVEETPVEETQPEQELTNEEMADAIVNDMAENPENYSEEEVFVYTK